MPGRGESLMSSAVTPFKRVASSSFVSSWADETRGSKAERQGDQGRYEAVILHGQSPAWRELEDSTAPDSTNKDPSGKRRISRADDGGRAGPSCARELRVYRFV